MKKSIDLNDHMLLAKKIHHVRDLINELRAFLLERKSTSRETSYLRSIDAKLDSLRSQLDNKYHAMIDDKTFGEHGHVYYSGEKIDENTGEWRPLSRRA